LARGDTRFTVRIENPNGATPVTFELAGPLSSGQTGLDVKSGQPGLVADLLSADGKVIDSHKSTIDIRAIESGKYYLHVYDPTGLSTGNVPFKIEVTSPIQGYAHPVTDRDRIHGGDGDDLIIGNQGLDRMWGDSGRDDFVAENLEVRDLDQAAGETLKAAASSERSNIPPEGPPVDAAIAIKDPALRRAVAQALGLPITMAYDGHYLIHVPNGTQRTDLSLTDGLNFRERIMASDLAEMTTLNASGLGITDLTPDFAESGRQQHRRRVAAGTQTRHAVERRYARLPDRRAEPGKSRARLQSGTHRPVPAHVPDQSRTTIDGRHDHQDVDGRGAHAEVAGGRGRRARAPVPESRLRGQTWADGGA
jgi:hypothetical protein